MTTSLSVSRSLRTPILLLSIASTTSISPAVRHSLRCHARARWLYGNPTTPCDRPGRIAAAFHTSSRRHAQSPTADALMENLNDLYSTAKDEFEIAAEETEKKTVYAAEDRAAAQEALKVLKEAFEKAVKESDPEVGKEVQGRVGPRIRELQNAVTAMEEMAMED